MMLFLCGGGTAAHGQLAITEVMSSESTNCLGTYTSHPDSWELTNFGTNTIDLTDYLFADADKLFPDGAWRLPAITISNGESIMFVGTSGSLPNVAAYRAWWGETNLPANLQVHFYPNGFGLNSDGDAVRLYDRNTNLVDYAVVDTAIRGISFTYDTDTGRFGEYSEVGVCGAFQAAMCGDIGSPGFAPCGPVSITVIQQPAGQDVDAGDDATFSFQVNALPRARLQWFFNGAPVSSSSVSNRFGIPVLHGFAGCGPAFVVSPASDDLTIRNVQAAHAGQYYAEAFNGLERLTSAVVTLTVNTNPSPARLECPPALLCAPDLGSSASADLTVTPGQTAVLSVRARGFPPPTFQWSRSSDGAQFNEISGATNRDLAIPFVQVSDAGFYRVRIQNALNQTNAVALLAVKSKPLLKVTEAMPDPCDSRKNWWELTNLGSEPVNLCGYRWDDHPGNIGGGPTIADQIIIQPGESIVFLESLTPEEFVAHWGTNNLPSSLQFVQYLANGLSSTGDEVTLWNPTATEDSDFIDSVVFSTDTHRATFWFAPNDPCSEFGALSVDGQCGSFQSALGCDIGSPGWTPWTPPQLEFIQRDGGDVVLVWKAQPGCTVAVQYTDQLPSPPNPGAWTELGQFSFAGATGTAVDSRPGNATQRFYRVVMTAAANCPCVEPTENPPD